MNKPEQKKSYVQTLAQERTPSITIWAPDKEKEPEEHTKMQALVQHVTAMQDILRPHGIEEVHIVPSTIRPCGRI